MKTNGEWQPLSPNHKIFVTAEHHFSTDTILLADFAKPRKKDICADFGSGCGTIAFLWEIRNSPKKVYAVEIQENAVEQIHKTVQKNDFSNIDIINADIKQIKKHLKAETLDLVACNPPYKAIGTGIQNEDSSKKTARHEEFLSLEDLAKNAKYVLKFGGRLCICQRPERLTDAMTIFRKYNLEPKILRFVQQRKNNAPSLFLLECRKGGKNALTVLPTLCIEEDGKFSNEMVEIYGDYKIASK